MSDVFLSYAKQDAQAARLIAEKLEAGGFSVWWDRQIRPGETWDEVIGTALNSASCVVVLWSNVSVQSRWVREEAQRGLDRRVLIPAFIERVEPPFGFGRIQAADLADWKGEATDPSFVGLANAVAASLKGPRPTPKPQVGTTSTAGQPGTAASDNSANMPQMPTPQFFIGRWRVDGFNFGSDLTYFPDGSFSGTMMQNIAGFTNQAPVFGRWNMQAVGPNIFRLQLWFANMTTWAGAFRIISADQIQNLELNYTAFRIG